MPESDTSISIRNRINNRIQSNIQQKEFFREKIIILDNEKIPLDSAIKSIDKVVYDQLEDVNNKLRDVRTAYQDRVDAGCRTDLMWVQTGVTTIGIGTGGDYYNRYTYTCQRTSPNGYGSITYISGVPDTTTSTSGLVGYQSKNLYGIKYYDHPYTVDVIDSFVAGFIGTVGAASSVVTAMVSVDSASLGIVTTGQLLISLKDGLFPTDANEIVGIGTTIADLSVINAGFSTQATVYTFTTEYNSLLSASAPEDDGSFVEFQVLKSSEQAGNLSISFGSNPYSPESIGIIQSSSDFGKGVRALYTNSGYPSATQSWRPELSGVDIGSGTISEPQVSAGKIYYNVGFTVKPELFSGGSWGDASVGAVGYLYSLGVGSTTLPIDTVRVSTISVSCTTEETALTNAISIANSAESDISSGTSTINSRMTVASTLRSERNTINIQIWGNRQLLGKLDEEITESSNVGAALSTASISGIIT